MSTHDPWLLIFDALTMKIWKPVLQFLLKQRTVPFNVPCNFNHCWIKQSGQIVITVSVLDFPLFSLLALDQLLTHYTELEFSTTVIGVFPLHHNVYEHSKNSHIPRNRSWTSSLIITILKSLGIFKKTLH